MLNRTKKRLLIYFLLLLVFVSSYFLFYNQAINDGTGIYNSDFPTHIKGALEGNGYSITSLLLYMSNKVGGDKGCAALMALVVVLTPFAAAELLMTIHSLSSTSKLSFENAKIIAISLCFIGSIYLPQIYPIFYMDPHYSGLGSRASLVTQPWHNSTYMIMRLFGLATLNQFFIIYSDYQCKGIQIRKWILFWLLLSLTNAAKPNFFIAFAPAMLLLFVCQLIKHRGRGFFKMLQFGSAALFSMPVLFLQLGILFPQTEEIDNQTGIELTKSIIIKMIHERSIIPFLFTGLAFSIIVTLLCLKNREGDFVLSFSWLTFFISFTESMIIKETGYRAEHGNFGWGRPFFAMVLIMSCVDRLLVLKNKKYIGAKTFFVVGSIFVIMILSGLTFFIFLLEGKSITM